MMKMIKNKMNQKSFVSLGSFLLALLLFFAACSETQPPIDEPEDLSMYITEVFEYVYAPGQHAQGRTADEKNKFVGKPDSDLYLGGFGGFVIAGFDHNIVNIADKFDFEIFSSGASPEPAIVYVMCDENGNGKPDESETWYELKGSEFGKSETIRNYSLTYYKAKSDSANITWKDNQKNLGELISGYSGKYTSGWWWNETAADSITFTGTRLPDAYVNKPADNMPQNWVVPDTLFTWGYAENNCAEDYDKTAKSNRFDISNAVDENGNPVALEHIRFIKIQTAVFQRAGWLNEVSSEVKGARDLHYPEKF